MNKTGKKNQTLTVGVIALIAILGLLVWQVGFNQQTAIGDGSSPGTPYISTGATTLTDNTVDALSAGTAVTATDYTSVNGAAFQTGVTSASPNNKLDILYVNGTTYHNTYVQSLTVPTSPTFIIPATLNGNAIITMTIFNTNDVVMTNAAAGGVNQTASSGATYNHKIKLQGQDKKNTQDMRCIFEITSAANTSDIVISGFGAVPSPKGRQSKPNWYTLSGVGSGVYVYDIQPIVGAETKEGNIQVVSQSGKTLYANDLITTCYTKEWFLDSSTGKVMYDVEDTLGSKQSMAAYKYTIQYWDA